MKHFSVSQSHLDAVYVINKHIPESVVVMTVFVSILRVS